MLNQICIEQKKQIGSKPLLGGFFFFTIHWFWLLANLLSTIPIIIRYFLKITCNNLY
jgi:hypothetical protein